MKSKVVFSSEIYVAAILNSTGAAARWLDIAANPQGSFELYASKAIIDETTRIAKNFKLPQEELDEFMRDLTNTVTLTYTPILNKSNNGPKLPDALICAIDCSAKFIISGSSDLLKLHPYKGMGIYPPDQMKRAFPPHNP